MSAHKTAIISPKVANPLPDIFPHAVKAGGLIFVSGSIGLDENSKMVKGGIQEHTVEHSRSDDDDDDRIANETQHQIIKNFKNVLEEAGSDLDKIVKINIFIANMDDFGAMNEVYTQYFKKPNLPCRTCVAVKTLPFNTDVEMECTALG